MTKGLRAERAGNKFHPEERRTECFEKRSMQAAHTHGWRQPSAARPPWFAHAGVRQLAPSRNDRV